MKRKLMIQACSWLVLASTIQVAAGADWASWRGPEQTGATREKAVVTHWKLDGENLLWKNPTGGRTTPIILNDRLYYIGPLGEHTKLKEAVFCLDANTGKTLWTFSFDMFLTDMAENRVGWMALAADPETGNIYVHTTSGEFACLSKDGKEVWRHSLIEEYSRVSGYGGRLHTPIVDEDRVIISYLNVNWGNQGRPTHRYVAFDKRTGKVIWWAEPGGKPEDTTYSTPVVTVINGRRMLIAGNADGTVYGLLARTGEKVWSFGLSKRGLNVTPVVSGNRVYIAHSEENLDSTEMGRVVCIDGSKTGDITKTGEIWRKDGVDAGYASLSINNGRLYVIDNSANLTCYDAENGKDYWHFSLGRVGKGSPVVTSDGVIYVGEQNGIFHILRDAGDKCESLDKKEFERPDHAIDEIFGSPAVLDGRVYFMTRYGMYCLASKDNKAAKVEIPPMPAEKSAEGTKAAKVFVFPADVTFYPGQSENFSIRLFNADGAAIDDKSAKPTWSLAGVKGKVDENGSLKIDGDANFGGGMLTAKVGELSGSARIRVVPHLPIKENFDAMKVGEIPPGWVGVMGKTRVTKRDDAVVFEKIAEKNRPSPAWRMRAFPTLPQKIGYTVQADMLGQSIKKRFKPDMGLINCRYEMMILGMSRELELSRWRDEPTCGLRKRIPFEFKPDAWYHMILTVDLKDGKALVKGKVWPRDEAEPKEWTIEAEDDGPTSEGSPGLYAYFSATSDKNDGPSVFFDNLSITENK